MCVSEFQVWMFGYHGSLLGSEKLSMSGFTFHFSYTSTVRFIIYNDKTNSAFTFIPRHLNKRKKIHVQRLNTSDVKQYWLECRVSKIRAQSPHIGSRLLSKDKNKILCFHVFIIATKKEALVKLVSNLILKNGWYQMMIYVCYCLTYIYDNVNVYVDRRSKLTLKVIYRTSYCCHHIS